MSDDTPPAVPTVAARTCQNCSKPLVDGGEFCPFCGERTIDESTASTIDAYIRTKLDQEIARRFTDQTTMIREIGDKAEDVVWRRVKVYTLFAIILLALCGFWGWRNIDDVSKSIGKTLSDRVEPLIKSSEQKAEAAQSAGSDAEAKAESVRRSLDNLATDVDEQVKRITARSGDISTKLEDYDAKATQLSQRLDDQIKSLESRVNQISGQVDSVTLDQVYPSLGQPKFVTLMNAKWKSKNQKPPGEKWVNIYIQPTFTGDLSKDRLGNLMSGLKTEGYTPILGSFGVGGPYFSGFGPLGSGETGSTIFYYDPSSRDMANRIKIMVSETLRIQDVQVLYVDVSKLKNNDDMRYVIENSGLDLQIYLRSPQLGHRPQYCHKEYLLPQSRLCGLRLSAQIRNVTPCAK
jgi:macrodomain Ter protein organizer (MatP/YcbG family)